LGRNKLGFLMSNRKNIGNYITTKEVVSANTWEIDNYPGIYTPQEISLLYSIDKWPPYPWYTAGEIEYTVPGTYSFLPPGDAKISVVCVGGGGGSGFSQSGAGGGGLGYKNMYEVQNSVSYTVVVGAGGFGNPGVGGDSHFLSPSFVRGGGGTFGGGNFVGDGGGNGGPGGPNGSSGGAAGYSGNGGPANGNAPPGGGGGGGPIWRGNNQWGGGGGGVGLQGQGNPGTVGAPGPSTSPGWTGFQGNGGSGGGGGELTSFGALHGGGGAGTNRSFSSSTWTRGGNGAVRIIWGAYGFPRVFPNTFTQTEFSS